MILSGLVEVILDVFLLHLRTIELNILVYDLVNLCTATQHIRHSVSMELKKFVIFQLSRCMCSVFLFFIHIINLEF